MTSTLLPLIALDRYRTPSFLPGGRPRYLTINRSKNNKKNVRDRRKYGLNSTASACIGKNRNEKKNKKKILTYLTVIIKDTLLENFAVREHARRAHTAGGGKGKIKENDEISTQR